MIKVARKRMDTLYSIFRACSTIIFKLGVLNHIEVPSRPFNACLLLSMSWWFQTVPDYRVNLSDYFWTIKLGHFVLKTLLSVLVQADSPKSWELALWDSTHYVVSNWMCWGTDPEEQNKVWLSKYLRPELYISLCATCNVASLVGPAVQQSDTPQGTVVAARCSLLHCCSQPFSSSALRCQNLQRAARLEAGNAGLAERWVRDAKEW